jgi:hypothetical protein
MKSSGQKAGSAIAAMIIVIVAAGIGVDWWDAHHGRPLPNPGELSKAEDETLRRLLDDIERLKTDNALLNLQNDALRKQIDELKQTHADAPKAAGETGTTQTN